MTPVSARCEVTVVIPTKNRWPVLLDAALRAASSQEEVDHEIVVVDDGSVDGTASWLADLGEPRLRVVRNDRSLGVARARNAGVDAARGAWIAFLDDDDIWSPRKLRTQIDAATFQGASFVYGASVALDERKRFLFGHAPPNPSTLRSQLLRRNVMWGGCSNVVVRADVLRDLGRFDEQLFQLADWDLWIRLADSAPAALCTEVLVGCVGHQASMLLTDRRDVFEEFDYLVRKHRRIAADLGAGFDHALFARWVAGGHVRAGRRLAASRALFRGAWRGHDVGNLVRIPGVLLGQPAMGFGTRLVSRVPRYVPSGERTAVEPDWLSRYW
ncbi:MAG: glycosyltransferase family 2 protein [Gaiellaceae bacterium]